MRVEMIVRHRMPGNPACGLANQRRSIVRRTNPEVHMDQKLTDAQKMNERFAEVVLNDAMQVVGRRIDEERACSGFSVEVYYSVENPFDEGTAEYAHFEQMLGHGSMKDPNYIDLSERILKGIKARLKELGVRPFVTLNCRFDGELEDNFLLYVFASI